MAELSPKQADDSRKSQTAVLRALASAGQKAAGDIIGKSETWVSRFASDSLKSCADLLAAIGLKIVPVDFQCYQPAYVDNLRYFAKLGMELHDGTQAIPVSPLSFEDDQ